MIGKIGDGEPDGINLKLKKSEKNTEEQYFKLKAYMEFNIGAIWNSIQLVGIKVKQLYGIQYRVKVKKIT